MPSLTVFHLSFPGGLHIGSHGASLEESAATLPADTLFAALLDAWRRSGGDPATWAAPFVGMPPDPPFLLTSAYPRAGDVRFYPAPTDLGRLLAPEASRDRRKELRRVRYLSEALVQRVASGERLDAWLFPADERAEPDRGAALQNGLFWLTVDEIEQLPPGFQLKPGRRHALRRLNVVTQTRVPRVTVDRIGSASTIYHVGRTSFAAGCGLWFGVQWRNPARKVGEQGPSYAEALETALALLQDDGLGGERSAGYGAFQTTMVTEPVVLPDPEPDGVAWLLSRYHPRDEAELAGLAHPDAAYSLVKVGGWLRSFGSPAQRRRRLTLLAEGSLVALPAAANDIAGDVVDVRPRYPQEQTPFPHPVYRYGLALGVGRQEALRG